MASFEPWIPERNPAGQNQRSYLVNNIFRRQRTQGEIILQRSHTTGWVLAWLKLPQGGGRDGVAGVAVVAVAAGGQVSFESHIQAS